MLETLSGPLMRGEDRRGEELLRVWEELGM
jgi:hypothetical protein